MKIQWYDNNMVGEHTTGQQLDDTFLHSVITETLRFPSHIGRFVISFEFEPVLIEFKPFDLD